ncbi:Polyketide synthase PksM [compost metagenome]
MARHDVDTYDKVFKNIQEQHGDIDAILYMWPLEDPGSVQDYSRIVFLLQAVLAAQSKPRRLLLAGQFGQEADLGRCYLESWIGFERSLGMIMPQTKVSGVYKEVADQNSIGDLADWLRKLWSELHAETAQTALYQGEKRHVSYIKPTQLQVGHSRLKTNGTYLITGGCGGLGFLLAKHLAKRYNANLILTGRSPIDPKKEAIIGQLMSLGSQAQYIQADVCDAHAMNTGLSESRKRFGAIHGVFHAAGIQSSQNLEEKEISNFHEILSPKIQGTLVMDELLQEDNLDFICYFSSSAAILGDFGFCDYAVGNRFQMAYAKYRNERQGSGRAITINWPVWGDGGMSIGDAETTERYLRSSGQRYLETEEGLDILERVLSQPQLQQQLVLAGQRSRVHRFLGLTEETRQKDQPAARPHGKGRQSHMLGWSTEQCLEADLKNWISEMLKHPLHKLKLNIQWMDYGFDSVLLAEFASYLSDRYQLEFAPSLFFSYTNLEQLIRYFLKEHSICIEEYYQESHAEPEALQQSDSPVEKAATGHRKVTYKPSVKREMTEAELPEPIAVIGMSGRFPQADHVEEFWQHLKDGTRCITEIPADRWDWRAYEGNPHLEEGKSASKWGAFLNNVDRFDPLFFKISPKESAEMDPRHRLFLEEAWRTFEDAGYMNERIKGKSCGVYVGVEEGEYAFLVKDSQYINGNQNATLPARIAYMLDLKGPNMAITAACSSGLVAIHQACQALRQGDCEMALVGGINLNISPMSYAALSKAEMLSPDGECRVFAQDANGMVPGEAVAAVLLKPLSKAIADQDVIYGCIKASGVNYDGRTNGITSPSPFSQAELVEAIYRKHQIDPLDIQYVMSHSTGSKLGDPLEIQALTSAFSKFTDQKQFCTIGSIKPLIGHTFAASGIVGLIGMLMAMRDRIIPGTRDNGAHHASIVSGDSPFVLSSSNQVWTSKDNRPRVGTVSATGISGTNAHIVVEEYVSDHKETDHPATEPSESITQIVVLSAKNEDRLRAACSQLLEYAESRSDFSMQNLAYTLQVGREAMDYRLALVVNDRRQLADMLRAYLHANKNSGKLAASGRIYAGDAESSVPSEEHLLPIWISERDYDRVAHYWVEGGHVSWEHLHESGSARRITLPGYPFAGERYWFEDSPSISDRSPAIPESELNLSAPGRDNGQAAHMTIRETIREAIYRFISEELNLAMNQLKTTTKLLDYGMDSIVGRKLMRHLENAFSIEVTGRELLEYPTIEALAAHLAEKANDSNERGEAEPAISGAAADYSDRQIIEKMEQFMQGIGEFEEIHQILEGSLKR